MVWAISKNVAGKKLDFLILSWEKWPLYRATTTNENVRKIIPISMVYNVRNRIQFAIIDEHLWLFAVYFGICAYLFFFFVFLLFVAWFLPKMNLIPMPTMLTSRKYSRYSFRDRSYIFTASPSNCLRLFHFVCCHRFCLLFTHEQQQEAFVISDYNAIWFSCSAILVAWFCCCCC